MCFGGGAGRGREREERARMIREVSDASKLWWEGIGGRAKNPPVRGRIFHAVGFG